MKTNNTKQTVLPVLLKEEEVIQVTKLSPDTLARLRHKNILRHTYLNSQEKTKSGRHNTKGLRYFQQSVEEYIFNGIPNLND